MFSREDRKQTITLSSAKFDQKVVKVVIAIIIEIFVFTS